MSAPPSGAAVLLGSGMAGLVAANLLAMRGWKVTVLEQHTRAGGFLHRFFRGGIGFDTGFHYVGSVKPGQLFARVLRHVGVYEDLDFVELDPDGFDELRFPGFRVKVPAGAGAWEARLGDLFPEERAGLRAFFADHRAAVAAYGLYHLDLGVPANAILPWEERSLQSVLDAHLRDPRLKAVLGAHAVLYGVPPDEAPFGMHALVTHHFYDGAAVIRGGGDRLAMSLVRRLKERGGRVVFRARATAVEVEGLEARAVVCEDGRRFPADLVFSSLHPAQLADLLPSGSFRPAWVERAKEARPGFAHFGTFLRLRGDLSALSKNNLYSFKDWDLSRMRIPAGPEGLPFYFVSAPGTRAEGGRPGSEQVVLGLAMTEWSDWSGWEAGRDAAYEARKSATLARFVEAVQADLGPVEVVRAEASTPLTTARYTGSRKGAVYGHYHSVDQMGRYRFAARTRVRNLLQIGQCVGFPGICGAAMTAYVAVGEVLGIEPLVEELRRS